MTVYQQKAKRLKMFIKVDALQNKKKCNKRCFLNHKIWIKLYKPETKYFLKDAYFDSGLPAKIKKKLN